MPVRARWWGPGKEVDGEADEFEPDLVGREVVQRGVPQAGVFCAPVRSSQRARARCSCSCSLSARLQHFVANRVVRQPSASVRCTCARGWGRSRRAMTRIPVGHGLFDGRSHRVSSATCAPSRACPSAPTADRRPPTADRQAWRGSAARASMIGWWAVKPAHRRRRCRRSRNPPMWSSALRV